MQNFNQGPDDSQVHLMQDVIPGITVDQQNIINGIITKIKQAKVVKQNISDDTYKSLLLYCRELYTTKLDTLLEKAKDRLYFWQNKNSAGNVGLMIYSILSLTVVPISVALAVLYLDIDKNIWAGYAPIGASPIVGYCLVGFLERDALKKIFDIKEKVSKNISKIIGNTKLKEVENIILDHNFDSKNFIKTFLTPDVLNILGPNIMKEVKPAVSNQIEIQFVKLNDNDQAGGQNLNQKKEFSLNNQDGDENKSAEEKIVFKQKKPRFKKPFKKPFNIQSPINKIVPSNP